MDTNLDPPNITVVNTPERFVEAVQNRALDIVVVEHLDLTTVPLLNTSICPEGCQSPLGEITMTRSIRGNCTTVPRRDRFPTMNGVPLVDNDKGQCLILTHDDLLAMVGPRLWVHNLYMRPVLPPNVERIYHFPALLVLPPLSTGGRFEFASVYMSDVILQGDGEGSVVGIGADDKVFVQNSLFTNLGGARELACTECSSAIEARASVHVTNSTFQRLIKEPGSRYVRSYKGGAVLLTNNTYDSATKAFEVNDTDAPSSFYADDQAMRVEIGNFETRAPTPAEEAPEIDPETGFPLFLTAQDEWFVSIQELLRDAPIPPAPPIPMEAVPAVPESDSSSDSLSSAAILALVFGLASLLAVLVAVCLCFKSRFCRRSPQQDVESQASAYPGNKHSRTNLSSAPASSYTAATTASTYESNVHLLVGPKKSSANHSFNKSMKSQVPLTMQSALTTTQMGGETMFSSLASGIPPPCTSIQEQMEFVNFQLDSMSETRLMHRFVLQGPQQRRQGGQGLVAFAKGAYDDLDYAIKFFLHRPSFDAECALYENHTLGNLLPQIEGSYDPLEGEDETMKDIAGNPLPPCIVMEKGESLNEWSDRQQSDVFQAVAVLAHVATRLRDMHEAGYVHRDLKPGNIMLLHRVNRWTLIDFGSVATIGEPARLSFTLHYAAPEVVKAWKGGVNEMVVTGALDSWALGVVAFELLTKTSAFNLLLDGRQKIESQILGDAELPWEGEQLNRVRRRLGKMRDPILALLERDPSKRMTPAQFCSSCIALYAVNTEDAPASKPAS